MTATVDKIEAEECQKHDEEMKSKQQAMPGPKALPPRGQGVGGPGGPAPPPLAPPTGVHMPLAMEMEADPSGLHASATSEGEADHKKVIMRFQGSEDFETEVLWLQMSKINPKVEFFHFS